MGLKTTALVGMLAIACVCLPISGGAQKPTRTEQARRVVMNNIRMATILANIAVDYDVTISLETDPEKVDSQINLDLRDVHFTQILDGIVKAEPRYQWRERDECIEVFPVAGGSSLLDTPIQTFRVKDVNRDLALNRLLGLPGGARPGLIDESEDAATISSFRANQGREAVL